MGRYWLEQIARANHFRLLRKTKSGFYLRSEDMTRNKSDGWHISSGPYQALVHHCAYDPLFYNRHMVDSLKFFTLIRDPYQRAQSCLFSLDINKSIQPQSLKTFYDDYFELIIERPSESEPSNFVPYPLRTNFIAYMLGYDHIDQITEQSLYQRFSWIGVLEELDRSFNLLEFKTNTLLEKRPHHDCQYKLSFRINNNANYKTIRNTVNCSFIERFKFANQLDYKIYYIALNKLYKTRDMRYFS